MLELKKVENPSAIWNFKEYYEGTAVSGAKVTCILDDNCVRYCTFDRTGKRTSRHEYSNTNKALCFRKATEALNRI